MQRPSVSDELVEELKRRTDHAFSVPDAHVTHEARVNVILDELDELKSKNAELKRENDNLRRGVDTNIQFKG